MLECVPNLSEGRDLALLGRLADTVRPALLDVHSDPDHHRSVFTMAGPADELQAAVRRLATAAVELLDLRSHTGAHPRLGVVDVVPFVDLGPAGRAMGADPEFPEPTLAAASFARWAGGELGVPCFLYGPQRSLPEVRREAFSSLGPDYGPERPHPRAGAMAVGVRGVMVAWNLWLEGQDVAEARRLAGLLRGGPVRALGFDLSGRAQLSFNLLDPLRVGPADVYDRAEALGARIARAETVGLVPAALVESVPAARRAQLDLRPEATIEAKLAAPPGSASGSPLLAAPPPGRTAP